MITEENILYTADEIKAMVKTCEKYNKAREKARELMDKGYDVLMPEIFPELNESEDERIRKAIIAYINHGQHCGVSNADMLAWLEKQDEKKRIFNADDWYVSEVDGKIHNAKFIEKQDGVENDMTVNLTKKDIIHLLRGVYNLDYETIFKLEKMGLGSYIGGFMYEFEWHSPDSLCWDEFSEQELYDLYIRITK